jgi:hypothetical protein
MKKLSIKYKGELFEVLIDDEDFDMVNQYHWNLAPRKNTNYVLGWEIGIPQNKQNPILMHRLIMGAKIGDPEIDHENHNGLNNQKYNLNFITHAGNARNCIRENKTHFTGVSEHRSGRFAARIVINKKKIGLGTYDTAKEAHIIYEEAKNNRRNIELIKDLR